MMHKITKIQGKNPQLYSMIAPLIMSSHVLRQNNNYPFKTSPSHLWFILHEQEQVHAFMPVEDRDSGYKIDNYFASASDKRKKQLNALLKEILNEYEGQSTFNAMVHTYDKEIFLSHGFRITRELKLYVKMTYKRI